MPRITVPILLAAALLAAGCASSPGPAKSPGEDELAAGIKSYGDADYQLAVKEFTSALDLHLAAKSSRITAHKYLAFIHCAYGRDKLCRAEFRKVLELDPHFELAPGEAGHPLWGPVFRSVKAEMAESGRQVARAAVPLHPLRRAGGGTAPFDPSRGRAGVFGSRAWNGSAFPYCRLSLTQFSSSSPGTLSNSRRLLLIRVKPLLRA